MAKTKKQIIKIIFLTVIVVLFVQCANQLSPPGGDVDNIPPTILYSYPENKTINFTENEIELGFSEYVSKRTINDAFFISPLIETQPNFSWTNKSVYIEFSESLKSNTTYSLVIGTEITDNNNNNNMADPFILTFSTGDQIDSGSISGKVYTDKSDGTMIFAYKIDSLKPEITTTKPFYLSQINDKGNYTLTGLSEGKYLLFAVKDEFKDLVYNVGSDLIGIPEKEVELLNNYTKIADIDFLITMEDTLAPNVQAVTMTDMNHIIVEFSEPIDSSNLNVENFSIIDSTLNTSYDIKYWYRTNSKKNEYVICISDSLSIDNSIFLNSKDIYDKLGNRLELETTSFIPSENPDTNYIRVNKIITEYSDNKIDYVNPYFDIEFSDATDLDSFNKAISFYDSDSIRIPIKTELLNNAKVNVRTYSDLKDNQQFRIEIDFKQLSDLSGNSIDTVISRNISTISELEFSGISGTILSNADKVNVVIKPINSKSESVEVSMDETKSFSFGRVLPGEYLVWAYEDHDSNNQYSHGKLNPLVFAEPFTYYPDTLNLRARWPVGDVEINFNKNK